MAIQFQRRRRYFPHTEEVVDLQADCKRRAANALQIVITMMNWREPDINRRLVVDVRSSEYYY